MVRLGELMMILELHRQGVSVAAIAAEITIGRIGDPVPLRSLVIYQAIGSQLATGGRP
jgi:hypothetical protein